MALNDYSSSTYTFSKARYITSGNWSIQTIETWRIFAGTFGITASNYSEYGLKSSYWSSSVKIWRLSYKLW